MTSAAALLLVPVRCSCLHWRSGEVEAIAAAERLVDGARTPSASGDCLIWRYPIAATC